MDDDEVDVPLFGHPGQQLVPGDKLSARYSLVTKTTTYDSSSTSPSAVTATVYAVPSRRQPTQVTADPAGLALAIQSEYEADSAGRYRRPSAKVLPAGNRWSYQFYGADTGATAANPCNGAPAVHQAGALWRRVGPDPDGAGPAVARIEEFVYDAFGRVVASRIGTGSWSCTTYDSRGRVQSQTVPAFGAEPARTVTYNYAVGNNPLITSLSDGAVPGSPNGSTITTTTDLLGRTSTYTDVWGLTTTSTFDQPGRLIRTVGPAGTVDYSPDSAGRVELQRLDGAVVADPAYTNGELTSVSHPANSTSGTIGRDVMGRLSSLAWSGPGGTLATDSVQRSQSGRVVDQQIDGADASPNPNFTYDGAGRLTTASVPGHGLTYAYAATSAGCAWSMGNNTNRTSTTDNGVTQTSCYDSADRLSSTTDSRYGGITYDSRGNTSTIGNQTLGYDGGDRHVTTTTPDAAVRYRRDATGRIVARELTPGAVGFRAASPPANNGSGTTSLAISAPAGTAAGDVMVAHIAVAGSSTLNITAPGGWTLRSSRFSSTASLYSRVYTKLAVTGEGAATWTFSASSKAAGGMASYSNADPATVVVADSTGTGTSMTALSVTAPSAGSQLLVSFGVKLGTTVSPSANMFERWEAASTGGNTTSRTTSESADQPVGAGATGTRTATAGASGTWFSHTIALAPIPPSTLRYGSAADGDAADVVMDGAGTVIERTIPLPDGALLTKRGSGDVWSYPNVHGDVMATAGSTGAKVGSTMSYDPYGQPLGALPDNSAGNFDYGWLGQHQRGLEHEGTVRTVEMGERQYVPGLGRFLEVDPIEGGCANDYNYVFGDPINSSDLTGQHYCKVVPAQAAIALGEAIIAGTNAADLGSTFTGPVGKVLAKAFSIVGKNQGRLLILAGQTSLALARKAKQPVWSAKVALVVPTVHLPVLGETHIPTPVIVPFPALLGGGRFTPKKNAVGSELCRLFT